MSRTTLAVAIAMLVVMPVAGHAQVEPYADRPFEVNVHVGGLALDQADTEVMVGGRVVFHTARGLGFGGNFDVASVEESDVRFGGLGFTGDLFLASGEVTYTFRSDNPVHVFVSLGVGAATFSPDEGDSESELLIPIGGGFAWFPEESRWAIRADVRDQIIRVENGESDTFHNWELSGGISFLFGL